MKRENIEIVLNKSELGAGTRGSGLGIDALMVAAMEKGSSFFKDFPTVSINDKNHILSEPTTHKWAKHIDSLVLIYDEVCSKVCDVISREKFPIIFSGDHASAGGTVAGIKKAHPDTRLGLIWIDAHADLHSPYTSPSGNVHGMPLATILNIDNLEFDPGDVADETKKQWEKLKFIGGIMPKALPKDLVFIGVRDTEKEEDYLIEKYGITNYTTEFMRLKGVDYIIDEIIEQKLNECDIIYISFDVDSLDSKLVSSGTGTPVENGLVEDEAKQILHRLMQWDKVVGLEVTEINPLLDEGNKMAETALDIIEHALAR